MASKKKASPLRTPVLARGVTFEVMRQRIVDLIVDLKRVKCEANEEGCEFYDCHVYLNNRADQSVGSVMRVLEHLGVDVSEVD